MNELKIFENPEFGKVRTMDINGEPWFVGKDVAIILGYAKPENAISTHVDVDDTLKQGVTDNLGRTQNTTLINESGLYSLILSSKLPKAKDFKRWVTSEVLPSIRKTGSYNTADTVEMSEMEMISKLASNAVKVEKALAEQSSRIDALENRISMDAGALISEALTFSKLSYEQQKCIKTAVLLRICNLSTDYKTYIENRRKYSNRIYADIRRRFRITSICNLMERQYREALDYIQNWVPPEERK